jgi:hypothetical protein
MKRFAKWAGGVVLLLLLVMQLGLAPVTHSARSITARVMDAETGEPIGGASVAAIYWISGGFIEAHYRVFAAQETTTAPDGTFHLPGFGPKLRWPPWGHVSGVAPQIVVFRAGHVMFAHANNFPIEGSTFTAGWVIRSQADGYVFQLEPVGPNAKAQDAEKQSQCRLVKQLMTRRCAWKQVPRLLAALVAGDRLRDRSRYRTTCGQGSLDESSRAQGCGPLRLPEVIL